MSRNTDNVILIGMPGSGKSTAGMALAKALGYEFVDADDLIRAREHATLEQIIARVGRLGFHQIESDVLSGIDTRRTVIAPGGSCIYHPRAMEHLRSIGTVVYLSLPLETVTERLGDLTARGVTFQPGQTLADLYAERVPLYEQYAHLTADTAGLDLEATVKLLLSLLSE